VRLAEKWARFGPPIIVFNKSHSGSRLLARLLLDCDVFLGAERNESEDAADLMRLVRHLVESYYPDYATLMREGDPELESLADSVFERHLHGIKPGQRWGWKLCETLYSLPVLQRIFPDATYVHLIRDGRDVAFCDHVAPTEPFWRKVYFDTDQVEVWDGRKLNYGDYVRAPHVFNARHWVNSVTVARHYGAMLGERYFEVRYEDLAARPKETALRLVGDLGLKAEAAVIETFAAGVYTTAVGKYAQQPRAKRAEALRVLQPTLAAFGYALEPEPPRGLARWLGRR
jgi:hypothetical protein